MSETRSIISLLLVMLWAESWASMAVLTAVASPKRDEAGLEKGEDELLVHFGSRLEMTLDGISGVRHRDRGCLDGLVGSGRRRVDEPLALVLFDRAAVLADEPFELGVVEPAARDDERRVLFTAA